MQFGITIKPDMTVDRIVALTRQAEAAGLRIRMDFRFARPLAGAVPAAYPDGSNTKNMRLGPCVTNPAVRDITVTSSLFATLNLISGGRMQLGIGRGDSSRRVLGKKPVTAAQLEQSVKTFRELTSGRETDYEGQPAGSPGQGRSSSVGRRLRAEGPRLAGRIATASSCNSPIPT